MSNEAQIREPPRVSVEHIGINEKGVPHLVGRRTKVYQIAIDNRIGGMSAEQIHEAYPYLGMAEIHAALAYYYDHQSEIDAYIEKVNTEYQEGWERQQKGPVYQALIANVRAERAGVTTRIYMDEHVPPAITEGLRCRGSDAITAQEDQHDGLPDERLLARVAALNCVLFTSDRDFCDLAARLQADSKPFAGIFYAKQGRLTFRECIDDLELVAQCTEPKEWQSQLVRLPL